MASLQHDFDYDHLPSIAQHPTRGQVLALGYLMICHRAYIMPEITFSDMGELAAMRLCHFHQSRLPKIVRSFRISSRLLREWAPYHRYAIEWHKCLNLLRTLPPAPFELTGEGLTFKSQYPDITALMGTLVLECGRGLASHWAAWKMEDNHAR